MANARGTMAKFHDKYKSKLLLSEQSSVDQLTRERALHGHSIQALERELEETRQRLVLLTTDHQVQLHAASQKSPPDTQSLDRTVHQDEETRVTKFDLTQSPQRYVT